MFQQHALPELSIAMAGSIGGAPIRCHSCNKSGHKARNCPTKSQFNAPRLRKAESVKQIPRLNLDSDNKAQTAWREGRAPDAAFRLPRGFDPFEQSMASNQLEVISASTQTHLYPKQIRGGPATRGIEILIWGEIAQCAAAKTEIQIWVQNHAAKRRARDRLDKIPAYLSDKTEAETSKALDVEARRQKYRQSLPSGKRFKFVVLITWADTDWSLEEVLGKQLEGLDPIRMDCFCYIKHLRTNENITGGPCLRLVGNREKKLQRAVERLKGVDKQLIARQFEHHQYFLVKPLPPPLDYSRYCIRHQKYNAPAYLSSGLAPENESDSMAMVLETKQSQQSKFLPHDEENVWSIENMEPGSIHVGARNMKHLNEQYFGLWTTSTLEYLPYFNGYLKMRASLGTCVFTNYMRAKNGIYDLDAFEEMLESKNTQDNELQAYFTSE